MNIPLFDLTRVIHPHRKALSDAFETCLDHSRFIMGPEVSEFERGFANTLGMSHVLSCSSGTDALLSIFMALELEPGSEVIVPSFTFVASASSIIRAGLKPVFADLSPDSFHISAETIKKVWTKKTKAVLFVHLFGEPESLTDIKALCDEKQAFLIEDCAQSYGSSAGREGFASAYSFFPAKNLGCLGDGGAVATNNEEFFKKLKMIRSHGSRVKYNYEALGGNFRMDTIHAAFLNVLLPHLPSWVRKRTENSNFYSRELSQISGVELPLARDGHAWNQYTIRAKRRDELIEHLNSSGVGNAVYYPIPLHKSVSIFGEAGELVETEKRCLEVVSIPIYPGLKDKERVYVVEKIKEFYYDT